MGIDSGTAYNCLTPKTKAHEQATREDYCVDASSQAEVYVEPKRFTRRAYRPKDGADKIVRSRLSQLSYLTDSIV